MDDQCDMCHNNCDTNKLKRHNSSVYGLLWLCIHCYKITQHINGRA